MSMIPNRLFQQPWPEGEHRMFQLGFLVDDLLVAARKWVDTYGVGPFHIMPRFETACTYRGKAMTLDMQIGIAQAGPVQIELIQVFSEGPSVYHDLHDRYGRGQSGIHQVCTLTPDYEAKKAHFEQLGYALVSEFTHPDQRIAFFDTVPDFGVFTEVVEQKASFLANLNRVSETCAHWDGSDPIRILTRDGYRTADDE